MVGCFRATGSRRELRPERSFSQTTRRQIDEWIFLGRVRSSWNRVSASPDGNVIIKWSFVDVPSASMYPPSTSLIWKRWQIRNYNGAPSFAQHQHAKVVSVSLSLSLTGEEIPTMILLAWKKANFWITFAKAMIDYLETFSNKEKEITQFLLKKNSILRNIERTNYWDCLAQACFLSLLE